MKLNATKLVSVLKERRSLLSEDTQTYNEDMKLVHAALENTSEFEIITKLIINMSSEQIEAALSEYI